jgi:hypothetical protein
MIYIYIYKVYDNVDKIFLECFLPFKNESKLTWHNVLPCGHGWKYSMKFIIKKHFSTKLSRWTYFLKMFSPKIWVFSYYKYCWINNSVCLWVGCIEYVMHKNIQVERTFKISKWYFIIELWNKHILIVYQNIRGRTHDKDK